MGLILSVAYCSLTDMKVKQILRPAGSTATRTLVCNSCGARKHLVAQFDNGQSGYVCALNHHVTFVFNR